MMTNDEIISTLNDLIETSKDGEHGFKTCAENVKDMELKQLFTAAAQRCAEGAKELQEQVRLLGGDPDEHSSVAGTLHRAGWISKRQSRGKTNRLYSRNASAEKMWRRKPMRKP